MRITPGNPAGHGVLPLNIAKAYGIKPPAGRDALPSAPNSVAHEVGQPVDSYQPSNAVKNLVAARVEQPVNFDAAASVSAVPQRVLQMYTRAADKVEAAVAVHIGRSIDLKG